VKSCIFCLGKQIDNAKLQNIINCKEMITIFLLPFLINMEILSQGDFDEYLLLEIQSQKIDIRYVSPLNSPIEIPGAIKGTVQSNTDWILMSSVEADFLSMEGNRIPLERLSWRIEGGEWVPFQMGEDKLLEGDATGETGRPFSIDLLLDLKWEDSAGDFLTNIDFTLMQK
jgi:hypothetical protein